MGSKANGNPESFLDRFSWGGLFQDFRLGFFWVVQMRWVDFSGKKKREDKRKKGSIWSVIFLHKHKNCIRDFCVISTNSYVSPMDVFICPTFFPLHYYTPTFSKNNKEKHTRKGIEQPRVKRNCNSSTASPLHPKDPKTPQGTRRSAGRFKTTPKASFTSWDAVKVRSFQSVKKKHHTFREVPISHTYPNCLWSKVENKSKTERWVHPTPFIVQTCSPQTCGFF